MAGKVWPILKPQSTCMSNDWIWDYKAETYILKYVKPNMANYHLNKISNS